MMRELIALSVLCGAALYLCPEGGVKRVLSVLSAALLSMSVLGQLRGFDYDMLAVENARLHEAEQTIAANGEDAARRMNRLLIEREYASWLEQQASALGLAQFEAEIAVEWSLEGFWVPYAAALYGTPTQAQKETLTQMLRDELGIPEERQQWFDNG